MTVAATSDNAYRLQAVERQKHNVVGQSSHLILVTMGATAVRTQSTQYTVMWHESTFGQARFDGCS